MLVSDTGSPNSEQIVITTALRGLVDLEIKLRVPKVICIQVSMGVLFIIRIKL